MKPGYSNTTLVVSLILSASIVWILHGPYEAGANIGTVIFFGFICLIVDKLTKYLPRVLNALLDATK